MHEILWVPIEDTGNLKISVTGTEDSLNFQLCEVWSESAGTDFL